jgi:5'-methylthioadenosine phosphorylase/purine-nucleoside phosphorylase
VNGERGMLGYTGTFRGSPVSVQSSGMGCPSAGIVIEELVQLGVRRILRVGTCGGLQPDLRLGDLIIGISATPADPTALHLTGGEAHAPTASWELVHGAVHAAKDSGKAVRVGPVVSSNVFYDPDGGRAQRWSDRGILAVEMEAAMLFTLGALRRIQTGCLLTVSDIVVEGEFVRISDEEMRRAVDQMTELALATVTSAKR